MQILRTPQELKGYLANHSGQPGCFADTTFLYGMAYDDDRLYSSAVETFEILAEFQVPIYANVISRMEFVDLIFRKQITLGAIEASKSLQQSISNREVFNLMKNIRDQDTAHRKAMASFKIGERQLKDQASRATLSGKFGMPPGCSGALRPENRVTARSKLPQKRCEGLHLPTNFERNFLNTLFV